MKILILSDLHAHNDVLDKMDDIQAPKPGTKGVVDYVDDAGTVHIKWETDSSLGLIPDIDKFHREERI